MYHNMRNKSIEKRIDFKRDYYLPYHTTIQTLVISSTLVGFKSVQTWYMFRVLIVAVHLQCKKKKLKKMDSF